MKTTNYHSTFIEVADDCPAQVAEIPPVSPTRKTIANLQYEMITEAPYQLTSDDVVFAVHATRNEISEDDRDASRAAFFSKGQPCLRSSPLAKRYGWGIHYDTEGRIALVAVDAPEYRELAADPELKHLKAMRSRRA